MGPRHEDFALAVGGLHKDFLGRIQPGFVGNNLRLEPGRFEFAGDIDGGIVVFFAGSDVRYGGERLQLFLRRPRVGHSEELFIESGLMAEVAIAQSVGGKWGDLGK